MSASSIPKHFMDKLRNIGIIAHIDAGKTTLTERILYYTHKIHRMGEVHDGTATMDFMPEEQERGITITSACTTCHWRDKAINIIDTPGHVDFTIEVERSLRVLDGAVGVFCAVGGVEPQSETVWRQSEKFHVPKLVFINKMDRPGANFNAVLAALRTRLAVNPLALQIPIGEGREFEGLIDLVAMERLRFDEASMGDVHERLPLSDEEAALAAPWREKLLESLAEEDDALMERYFSGEPVLPEMILPAVRKGTLARRLTPVLLGSALKNIGVQPVLDAVCDFLPSPVEAPPVQGIDGVTKSKKTLESSAGAPLAALVFKVSMETGRRLVFIRMYSGVLHPGETTFNVTRDKEEKVARLFRLHAGHKEKIDKAVAGEIVAAAGLKYARTGDTLCLASAPVILESIDEYKPVISIALEAKNTEDGDRLDEVLEKFLVEDPTLFFELDKETGQRLLSGMGELHLEVVLDRLRREYGLDPRSGNPQVVYQETITREAEGIGEFERELGGDAHYGYVVLRVEPLPRDKDHDVVFEVDVSAWPDGWLEAVAEGIADGLQSGVIKGYPVQNVRVEVLELRKREGESSAVGYRMAAVGAMKKALAAAAPALLEPIMWVEIAVPEDFVGEAISLLGARGAKVENMFDRAGLKVVQALTPMRQLFGFSTSLRSATQGRAGLIMKFSRFDMLH
jgi:elongation factor G